MRETRRLGVSGLAAIAAIAFAGIAAAPALAVPPPNDNYVNAAIIPDGLPQTGISGTDIEATGQAGEGGRHTVWYRWKALATGRVTVDLCPPGGNQDTELKVSTGNTLADAINPANQLPILGGNGGCHTTFSVASGTTYNISINHLNFDRAFTLNLTQHVGPANDDFANRQVVGPDLPVSVPGTNVESTYEPGQPSVLGFPHLARTVWYEWSPATSGNVRADFCQIDWVPNTPATNVAIGVYEGDAFPLSTVAQTGSQCQITFNAQATHIYKIGVSGESAGEGNFTFKINSTTPPANDAFASPVTIPAALPASVAGNNTFATAQPPSEPDHSGPDAARSVWFKWTPTSVQNVRIRACPYTFGTRIGVYTGTTLANLAAVGTPPGPNPSCSRRLTTVANTTYYIAVDSSIVVGDEGPFTVEIREIDAPDNDLISAAQPISGLPVSVAGTNLDATREPGETAHWDDVGNLADTSVWFAWTAPATQEVTLSTCGTAWRSVIGVYTGATIPEQDGSRIVNADDGCAAGVRGASTTIQVTGGQTYRIAVDGRFEDEEGAFTLSITDPNATPPAGGGAGGGGTPPAGGSIPAPTVKKCKKKKSKKASQAKKKKCSKKKK